MNKKEINKQKYAKGFGRMQYLRALNGVRSNNEAVAQHFSDGSADIKTDLGKVLVNVANMEDKLSSAYDEISFKLDYMVNIFKSYENKAGNTETVGSELIIRDSIPSEKVFIEKKGLFGKTKLVEEKI